MKLLNHIVKKSLLPVGFRSTLQNKPCPQHQPVFGELPEDNSEASGVPRAGLPGPGLEVIFTVFADQRRDAKLPQNVRNSLFYVYFVKL